MSKRLTKQDLLDAIKSQVAEKRPDLTKTDVETVSDDSIKIRGRSGGILQL